MSGDRWGKEEPGGIGSGGGGGSPWMADPEEGLRSGVQVCSDPLRGICCKARCHTPRCRTAAGRWRINKMRY